MNDPDRGRRHMHAWMGLVAALAIHVLDEALTGFLDFYNPLVQTIRSRVWWFPMPTFAFDVWLGGLLTLVVVLLLLGPAIRHGATGTRVLSWALAAIMFLNGVGHLVGSMYFERWLPGATTAPLLLLASANLARRTAERPARFN